MSGLPYAAKLLVLRLLLESFSAYRVQPKHPRTQDLPSQISLIHDFKSILSRQRHDGREEERPNGVESRAMESHQVNSPPDANPPFTLIRGIIRRKTLGLPQTRDVEVAPGSLHGEGSSRVQRGAAEQRSYN
jgi:hypothetical protein